MYLTDILLIVLGHPELGFKEKYAANVCLLHV